MNLTSYLKAIFLSLGVITSLGVFDTILSESTLVGHTKLDLSIGENGAAIANIPINLPKGTILQPSLSLSYNSQGANGLLGLGWSLNGVFQTITRSPATVAQDGFIDGVDFDDNDRFALNGERLTVVSGDYASDQSSYRTEQSNFSKVVAYESTGYGPQYFKVWTKDGLILEFGRSEESRVGVANEPAKVMIWLLNKITDTNGNYILISYQNDVANGEFRPSSIMYTGNDAGGTPPASLVNFEYEDRPDVSTRYMAGQKSTFTKRLRSIYVYDDDFLFRWYQLDYLDGIGVSKLHEVTEHGADGASSFKPIIINWIENTREAYDFNKVGTGFWQGHSGGVENNVAGDFNGDGRTDLARYADNGTWEVSLANGNSLSTGSRFDNFLWQNGHFGGVDNNVTGDFNGDGLTDLAGFNRELGQWQVSLSTGTGFSSSLWQGHIGGVQNNVVGDFNGDGRTDLAGYAGDGEWHVSLSTGSGFNSSFWVGHLGGAQNNVSGDFNGDGRTDLAGYAGEGQWHITLSTGSSFAEGGFWSGHWGGANNNVAGDFNRDGLTDLAGYNLDLQQWQVSLSSGTSFITELWQGHIGGIDNNVIGDFNGDGRTDLAGYDPGINKWHVTLSTGSGFEGEFWDGHAGGIQNNVVGDFDGNGMTDILGYAGNATWHVALSNAKKELVTNIVYGNEQVSVFEYQPITNTSTYTKGNGATYPMMDLSGAMYVVSVSSVDDGIGGRKRKGYQYFDAQYDHTGRGFRGFNKRVVTDSVANSKITTIYNRDYRLVAARINKVVYETLSGDTIMVSENTSEAIPLFENVYFSYYKQKHERTFDLSSGSVFDTKITDFSYDNYGNALTITENHNAEYVVETRNTYTNDIDKWHLGRLIQSIVTKRLAGKPEISKKSTFEYDDNGNLITETLLPNHPTRWVETKYALDDFGNRVVTTQRGADIETRSDYYRYDQYGRFVLEEENELGHIVSHNYDFFGYLASSTNSNDLTTTYTRDGFGRVTRTEFPDGTWTTNDYNFCQNCPVGAAYFTEVKTSGLGFVKTYYDKLDRPIKTVSEGFNGVLINVETAYNADGTVREVSNPYYDGGAIHWTTFEYDEIKRTVKETRPGDEVTRMSYEAFSHRTINAEGQTSTTVVNSMGKVEKTIDHYGSELSLNYDSDLNLIARVDFNGNTINYGYDIRGFKITMSDPSMGTYDYKYNTLGQLTSQTYPNGNTVSLEYDVLNRVTKRVELEGVTEWGYDPEDGVGQVSEVIVNGNVEKSYTYNVDGKLQTTTYVRNNQGKTFTYSYNSAGLLDTEMYPNGYKIFYTYTQQGLPLEVYDYNTEQILWEATQYDENLRNTGFKLGNGLETVLSYNDVTEDLESVVTGRITTPNRVQNLQYSFSKLGNLQQRKDQNLGLTESFEFDELNRLTKSIVPGVDTLALQYDLLGNIIFKSDVGHYRYGENGRGAHVLTSINHEAVPNCIYNLQQNVTYSSYNYTTSISNLTKGVEIEYGGDRSRKKLHNYLDGELTSTKIYAGNNYEEVTTANGEKTETCYLRGGSKLFGFVSKTTARQEFTYVHSDHLGSIDALTNESGAVLERRSYDAWGKQRDPYTWERLELPPVVSPFFAKGYTSHEMLDVDWLVCMNARVYNPILGRFLSPDPFIQYGENMQNLNRFAYVLNNPLSNTDPTGYFSFSEFAEDTFDFVKENIGTVVGIAISASLGGLDGGLFTSIFSGALGGFGASFTDALLAGGSLSDSFDLGLDGGLWGAVSAGVSYGIGSAFQGANAVGENVIKPVIHGVAQGSIAEKRGGDFKSGFYGGAVAEFGITAAANTGLGNSIVVGAVVGGTASQLSGGKFANGAFSGAFIAIYNNDQHIDNQNLPYDPPIEPSYFIEGAILSLIALPFRAGIGLVSGVVSIGRSVFMSTGRMLPRTRVEYKAWREIKRNPENGKVIIPTLGDARFKGYSKMTNKNKYGVEIHYNAKFKNNRIVDVTDVKFK